MIAPDGVVAVLSTEYNASLDAWTASTGVRALPYGTYELRETVPPEGYLLSDEVWRFEIRGGRQGCGGDHRAGHRRPGEGRGVLHHQGRHER